MTTQLGDKFCFCLKALIFLACLAIFIASASTVLGDFRQKLTNTVISHLNLNQTELPVITICPVPPLKTGNLSMPYNNRTFSVDEVVAFNPSKWTLTETKTLYHGLCFSFKAKSEVGPVYLGLGFALKQDVQIILSEPGIEPWLVYAFYPFTITSVLVGRKNGMVSADLHLAKKETHILTDCHDYDSANLTFTDCAVTIIKEGLHQHLNCSIEEFEVFDLDLPVCQTLAEREQARKVARIQVTKFTSLQAKTLCPQPCRRVTFKADINYFHESVLPHFESTFVLMIYYDSLLIETIKEHLVYDEGRLLSALGGSFGLLLGFSCLGILNTVIDLVQRLFVTQRSRRGIN